MNFKDYNTCMLGYDYDTTYAFLSVATRLPDTAQLGTITTNHIKLGVYTRTFPVKSRDKYTGFEFVEDLDKIARQKISDSGIDIKRRNYQGDLQRFINEKNTEDYRVKINLKKFEVVNNIQNLEDAINVYRQHLINNALKYQGQPNVLYFSGGADSEMVLWSFIEAGVDFVPVTFVYTDNSGNVLNYHDTVWADEFCKEHNLTHIKREFDVEKFWQSPELVSYAQSSNTSSPQFATYFKMVDLVHEEIEHTSFDQFAGRPYHQFGRINIPKFPIVSAEDFVEVAPDIWSLKLLTDSDCQKILDIIRTCEFSSQVGDLVPMEELLLEELDCVFYNSLIRYLESHVGDFYNNHYNNTNFSVLSAWFDRLGANVQSCDVETDAVRLHHDKSRITMSLVLNNDFTGGDLWFPRQNFKNTHIAPGTLLMWPGLVTHPKCVLPVTSGTRYTMIIFTKLETFSTRFQQLQA
jgi:hypothetical protein